MYGMLQFSAAAIHYHCTDYLKWHDHLSFKHQAYSTLALPPERMYPLDTRLEVVLLLTPSLLLALKTTG